MSNKARNLYRTFLGFLIKKGNFVGAKKILDTTFFNVSKKTGFSTEMSLIKLFLILNTYVEVKRVRVKRRSFLVPFYISLKRRSYLIVRWLMQIIKKDKKRDCLSNKLSMEILNILKDSNSSSKKLKRLNISQAIANRSNIHYRW